MNPEGPNPFGLHLVLRYGDIGFEHGRTLHKSD